MNDLIPPAALLLRTALAVLPVLVFLAVMIRLDCFGLVGRRAIASALAAGAVGASASYVVNSWLVGWVGLSIIGFAVLVAPVVEEGFKVGYAGWLVQTRRVGFLVDAAILGFATGTGFALAENIFYLSHIAAASLLVWAVRGLGTALMHGGATATAAVILQGFGLRCGRRRGRPWATALAVAVLIHAAFNRFLDHPVAATLATAAGLPLVFFLAYRQGEVRLRRWLGKGFDHDAQLLILIRKGEVAGTPLGLYLAGLRQSFRPDTVADLLCLLRVQAELNIMAKGVLILREQGLPAAAHPRLREKLQEIRWLEASVGRTGLLALRPLAGRGGRHRWQRRLLEDLLQE